jgi:hypothetical protein
MRHAVSAPPIFLADLFGDGIIGIPLLLLAAAIIYWGYRRERAANELCPSCGREHTEQNHGQPCEICLYQHTKEQHGHPCPICVRSHTANLAAHAVPR